MKALEQIFKTVLTARCKFIEQGGIKQRIPNSTVRTYNVLSFVEQNYQCPRS